MTATREHEVHEDWVVRGGVAVPLRREVEDARTGDITRLWLNPVGWVIGGPRDEEGD